MRVLLYLQEGRYCPLHLLRSQPRNSPQQTELVKAASSWKMWFLTTQENSSKWYIKRTKFNQVPKLSHSTVTTAFKRCLLNLVQLITFLEFFLFGDIVALFWSVGVGGFDWLVAEAEALLLPPLGDIGGKLVADGLLVFRKLVLLLYWGIWKLLKLKLTFWVMIMICN